MARITEQRSVTVTCDPATALQRAAAAIIERKHGRVEHAAGNKLEGRVGSQAAIRLKGGMIASIADFPLVAAVEAVPRRDGAEVRLTVADDLGFGFKFGMKAKYTRAASELADLLVLSVAAPSPAIVPAQPPPVAASVADELAKLADLHASGVLTNDEFASQKGRLLR